MDRIGMPTNDDKEDADDVLLEMARNSPDGFAALYDCYAPRVFTYIRYRVEDIPTAEDLTAQAFEQVLIHLPRFHSDKAPFGAWLFGIVRHTVSHHRRAQQRQRWLSLDAILHRASDDPLPEAESISNETHRGLLRAVACLSERERDLLALKFAAGLNNRHIARLTGLSESNVGVVLFRSLKRLRSMLNEQE
jgi:RNA polymerase sigma-70 factor (ECF subfamily)